MTEPTDLDVTHAYSRQEVEVYLSGVEEQRAELEAAIEAARARTGRARELERRIVALEHRVGQWIVEAHVPGPRRGGMSQVFTDAPGVDATTVLTRSVPSDGAGSTAASAVAPIADPKPSAAESGWEAQGA